MLKIISIVICVLTLTGCMLPNDPPSPAIVSATPVMIMIDTSYVNLPEGTMIAQNHCHRYNKDAQYSRSEDMVGRQYNQYNNVNETHLKRIAIFNCVASIAQIVSDQIRMFQSHRYHYRY